MKRKNGSAPAEQPLELEEDQIPRGGIAQQLEDMDDEDAAAAAVHKPRPRFRPLGMKLVVEPIAEGERVIGSLVIPDTAKERPSMGRVVALGSVCAAGELQVGDRIVYGKYSGHELTIDEVSYIILAWDDVLTILDEDPLT